MGLFDSLKPPGTASAASAAPASNFASLADHDHPAGAFSAASPPAAKTLLLLIGVDADWLERIKPELAAQQPDWQLCPVDSTAEAIALLQNNSYRAVLLGDQAITACDALISEAGTTVALFLCDATTDRARLTKISAAGGTPISDTADVATLIATIHRQRRIHEWMLAHGVKKLLSQCHKLPVMPRLYSQVSAELSSPDASLDNVARLIAQDPVMTARILQVVNSAFFGLGRELTDAYEAVLFLGAERTRTLLLLAGVLAQFEGVNCPGFAVEQIWNHSLQVGTMARTITVAEVKNIKLAEAAFTAGLIHDMGKLVLAANLPVMCTAIDQISHLKNVSQREAELQVLGTTHAELAACLLAGWGIALPVLEAVAWHHCPTKSDDKAFTLLTAVHAANILAYEAGAGGGAGPGEAFDYDYLVQVARTERRNDWRKACGLPVRPDEDADYKLARAQREDASP